MHKAHRAYAAVAKETAGPRELEASLLLKAASKLQSVYDGWNENPNGLYEFVSVSDGRKATTDMKKAGN